LRYRERKKNERHEHDDPLFPPPHTARVPASGAAVDWRRARCSGPRGL
jgi:hypothetical protein